MHIITEQLGKHVTALTGMLHSFLHITSKPQHAEGHSHAESGHEYQTREVVMGRARVHFVVFFFPVAKHDTSLLNLNRYCGNRTDPRVIILGVKILKRRRVLL